MIFHNTDPGGVLYLLHITYAYTREHDDIIVIAAEKDDVIMHYWPITPKGKEDIYHDD